MSDKPHVHTAHNQQVVNVENGDFIFREPNGQGYYPVKPDVFWATYVIIER